jgi:hypothetical protein
VLRGRNAANSGDVEIAQVDAADDVILGDAAQPLRLRSGLFLHGTATVSANATVADATVSVHQTDSTAAARSHTLPAIQGSGQQLLVLKDTSGAAGTNGITYTRAGTDLIDGQASLVINDDGGYRVLLSDPGPSPRQWRLIGSSAWTKRPLHLCGARAVTATSASPFACVQVPSELLANAVSVKLKCLLTAATGATATVKLRNLTDAADVVIGAASAVTMTSTSTTPELKTSTELVGATGFSVAAGKVFELRFYTSDSTKPCTLGMAWLELQVR